MTFVTRCAVSMKCLETLELCLTPPSTDVVTAFDGSPPPPSVLGSLTEIYTESTPKNAKTILEAVCTPSLVHLYLSVWIVKPRTCIVDVEVAAIIQGFIRNNRQHAKDKLGTLHISVRSLHRCLLGSFDSKCFEHLDVVRIQAPFHVTMSELEST